VIFYIYIIYNIMQAKSEGGVERAELSLTVEFPPIFVEQRREAWSWHQQPINISCTGQFQAMLVHQHSFTGQFQARVSPLTFHAQVSSRLELVH
jgi:hypothetical protein